MRKILILLAALALMGCKTVRYVPMETVKTDTIWQKQVVMDSVRVHDSVYVKEWMKGDTVYVDRAVWHTAIQERLRADTVYRNRVDSVAVPYPVEKQLTKWQRIRMDFGGWAMGLLVLSLVVMALRNRLRW